MKVDEVISLFKSVTNMPAAKLSPEMVVADAGIGSLDIMRLVMLLETNYGIEIGGDQIGNIANGTFQEMARSIGLIDTRSSVG